MHAQARRLDIRRFAARCMGVALIVMGTADAADAQRIGPRFPPHVERATLQKLPRETELGNARLQVRFAREENVGDGVVLYLEDQKVALRDDGLGPDPVARDGVFNAVLRFNFEEFLANQRRRAQVAREFGGLTPVFSGRTRVTMARVQTFTDISESTIIDLGAAVQGLPFLPPAGNTLAITNTSVVEDQTRTFDPCTGGNPTGPWSFGYLMTQLANEPVTGISPSQFVRNWLATWESPVTVNGFTAPIDVKLKQKIIDRWVTASGGPDQPLDLSKAPFRLLAIMNRVDLRANSIYGGGSAGEARFVFGGVDLNHCAHGDLQKVPFTVIFEYGITRAGCGGVRDWAKQWQALGSLPLGSAAYNAALQAITDTFTIAGAEPAKPNQSALNQLRTNHELDEAREWELREFRIKPNIATNNGPLAQFTVKQTPDDGLDFKAVIANYVNQYQTSILKDRNVVPAEYPVGTPFLGAVSISRGVLGTPLSYWDGPTVPPGPDINNPDARFHFSLNTCSGCHMPETKTSFTHIFPRMPGVAAKLSGFLTGIDVEDPADHVTKRHFDDLARRAQDLDSLANSGCLSHLFFSVMEMAH